MKENKSGMLGLVVRLGEPPKRSNERVFEAAEHPHRAWATITPPHRLEDDDMVMVWHGHGPEVIVAYSKVLTRAVRIRGFLALSQARQAARNRLVCWAKEAGASAARHTVDRYDERLREKQPNLAFSMDIAEV